MPHPVRISLRLLGLVLLLPGAVCLALLFQPGPHAVAVLRIITRPEGMGPLVINLRRRPRL